MGAVTNSVPLDWQNVFAVGVGAEYWAMSTLALRAGSTVSQSATPDHAANIFLNPPGLLYSVHAGAGMTFTNLDLDLGGYYAVGSRHVASDPTAPTVAGDYGSDTVMVSLSGTYRM
jgi:long-subunit fatty acid transport protein